MGTGRVLMAEVVVKRRGAIFIRSEARAVLSQLPTEKGGIWADI